MNEKLQNLYNKLSSVDKDNIVSFLDEVRTTEYADPNELCHLVAISAIGAATSMAKGHESEVSEGMNGDVMWFFIQGWMNYYSPLKMVKFDEMLFPQFEERFQKTIPTHVFEWLQNEASIILDRANAEGINMSDAVKTHLESIVKGVVPFGYKVVGS